MSRAQLIQAGVIKPASHPVGQVIARRMTRDFVTRTDKAMAILRKAARRHVQG